MKNSFSLEQLAKEIGGTFKGDATLPIKGVASLDAAGEGDLTFLTNPRYAKAALSTKAAALLCENEIPGLVKPCLFSKNPYGALAKIIGLFHPGKALVPGIQPGSFVDSAAKIHPLACVSAGASVAGGAVVGQGSILYPGVYVGENAVVGADCLLYSNVTLRENCILGDRVILQPGVVIGSDGFGFARDGEKYIKIPQVGNVVVESDVEIGANTCVDRAVLGTTRIRKGAKLDNLIQVGHNVEIGENTVMAALTGISGSTKIGSRVVMGGQVGIAGHLKIGDEVTLATRTGVMEDILTKGVYWGSPSTELAFEMKNVAAYRQLPQLIRRVRNLEKALEKFNRVKNDEK